MAAAVVACSPASPPSQASVPAEDTPSGAAAIATQQAAASTSPSPAPIDPASETTVEAFLAFARSASQSFEVEIAGDFTVGQQAITFSGTGYRSGQDGIAIFTQTSEGESHPMGMGTIGGRAYNISNAGWTPQSPEIVAVLNSAAVSLAQAIVIEDLGRDPSGGHRLRISAGLSLYPYQMASIKDAYDLTERLEIVVDDAGVPLTAIYTRSVSGTIDGAQGTASGQATFTFKHVGARISMPTASLVPGATLPPAVSPSPSPALKWATVPLAYAPLQVEMPGAPKTSSQTVPNQHIGPYPETDYRLTLADGSKYTLIESQFPQSYIDAQGADAITREVVAIEAKNLGATIVGERPLVGSMQPGLDALLATQTALYRLRILVVGRDVLELVVAGAPGGVANADADRFLGSPSGS